jgi:hypothetical protein
MDPWDIYEESGVATPMIKIEATIGYCPAKIQDCPNQNPECEQGKCSLNYLPPQTRVCPRCGSGAEKIDKGLCKNILPDGKLCCMKWQP